MKELGILALILAVTVAIYKVSAMLAAGKRNGRRPLPGSAGPSADSDSLVHRCYQVYVELEEKKRNSQTVMEAFTGQAGIINRIQLLLGYGQQAILSPAEDKSAAGQQGRAYLQKQLETIHAELIRLDQKKAEPSMTEAQYAHNLQTEGKRDEELSHLFQSLSAQRARMERDEEHRFYQNLKQTLLGLPWDTLLAEESQDSGPQEFADELKTVCEGLTMGLRRSGLACVWYADASAKEQETWFLALPDAREYPCVVRVKDRILIAFGRVKRQEAARQQNAG